ncbi:hypothetical protein BN2475_630001 [Paraburkholderia ribeironis]|uniref:Uncharacterized protein n=1 Tax=Paraburkholderia ribeironis TaxID=1247936 RepID=A0A1N7SFL6_9BURK|nr:hypothetical protein BN2475_630001 [Paraburkholderia ribeironis]
MRQEVSCTVFFRPRFRFALALSLREAPAAGSCRICRYRFAPRARRA